VDGECRSIDYTAWIMRQNQPTKALSLTAKMGGKEWKVRKH
jgi:hypothetical protein